MPDKKPRTYKHMSCVIGHRGGDIARLIEAMQKVVGLSDSEFLRSIVYSFLVDSGYAHGTKDDNGLTEHISVDPVALKAILKNLANTNLSALRGSK